MFLREVTCPHTVIMGVHVACREGHMTAVQYFLHQGALVHLREYNGITALQDAVTGRHQDIIKLLMKTESKLIIKPQASSIRGGGG